MQAAPQIRKWQMAVLLAGPSQAWTGRTHSSDHRAPLRPWLCSIV